MTTLRQKMKDEMQLKGLFFWNSAAIFARGYKELYEHYKRSPAKLEAKAIPSMH